ncbi:MAG: hypothetical protein FJZ58_01050 [Chlamydiae bacterium]|nr:hypothetical protein [Chlamydiota bacterium]
MQKWSSILAVGVFFGVALQDGGAEAWMPYFYQDTETEGVARLCIYTQHEYHADEQESMFEIFFRNQFELEQGLQQVYNPVVKQIDRGCYAYSYLEGGTVAREEIPYLEETWKQWETSYRRGIHLCGWDRGSGDGEPKSEEAKPFFSLPLTNEDKKNIRDLISCMADKNLWQLLMERKLMEKKADKIRKIHPLRFAGFVLVDPHMKRCMRAIEGDPLKWAYFIEGYAEKMHEEAKAGRLLIYAHGFAECISADPQVVQNFLHSKDYEGFIKNFL